MEIGSLYTDYLQNTAANTATSKVENKLKGDMSKAEDEELLDVCKQFEAYFYEQIFKKMEDTLVPASDDSDPNNTLVDYYKDGLIQEYSKSAAGQQKYGLAQTLYEQMKRNYKL